MWQLNRMARERGQSYRTANGKTVHARKIQDPCNCEFLKCYKKYSDPIRGQMLRSFLKLSLSGQNQFISNHMAISLTARPTVRQISQHRMEYIYLYTFSLNRCLILDEALHENITYQRLMEGRAFVRRCFCLLSILKIRRRVALPRRLCGIMEFLATTCEQATAGLFVYHPSILGISKPTYFLFLPIHPTTAGKILPNCI